MARILVFKIRPSQEILQIRDGTPLEAEGILTYRKRPSKWLGLALFQQVRCPSNVVQKKRVVRILVFKIRPSQEILKIRDAPLEAEGILTYGKKPSQEILKIRDGTPLEAEGILTYRKKPSKLLGLAFSNKLDVPSKVIQKKRVVRILVFKIRPSQEILKIRDGTPLEAEGILTYRKKILQIRDGTPLEAEGILTYRKRPSKWLEPSQEILQIRDGTPLEAEGILTYRKRPSKWLGLALFQQVRCPSNVVQKKRVVRILVFKIRPSQEILKIRDAPLEAEGILTYGKKPSQEILKIRDGTPLEAEGILTYRKKPSKLLGLAFSNKLDVPSKVIQKKRVVRILVFKIRPSQEILKIRDGTPLELDVPSNVVQKKRVARILVFKIRPSQEILQIRDGTPLEAEGILTYRKRPSKWLGLALFQQVRCPSNVVQKKRVVRILVFKIRPSQEILKIRDGTPLEAEGILTYRKKPSKLLGLAFSNKLDVPSKVIQKKRVVRILVFKIRPSQEILKIRDGTPLKAEGILTYRKKPSKLLGLAFSNKLDVPSKVIQKKRVARILVFKIRPYQEILQIRDGTPLEAEGILTYRKKPSKLLGLAFSNKLDVPSKVIQKKRVVRILVFKIRPYQEILKIRDGTPLEAEGILTYRKKPSKLLGLAFSNKLDVPSKVIQKKRVVRILVFKIRPSQEILKIRDGTPLEAEGILTYRKKPSKLLGLAFSNKLDVPSKVIQKKRVKILQIRDGAPLEAEGILTYRKRPSKWLVARILVFKIRPSQEILKVRDGTPLEAEGILTYRKRPSQEILQIRDGTPLEAEGILTYRKRPSKWLGLALFQQVRCPSNVVQKKRVARILVFKIRPSQEILKIRDGTPLEAEGILTYRKRPYQEILKIRDGTPLEAEGILTYRKKPSKLLGLAFSNKLDVPSKVIQKKRVVRILVFKIRPSQEILKIRDGTPLEAEGILTYRKRPSKWLEILKIRDGTPLEAEGILTYRKKPSKLLGL
ncbi:hypothetical protein OROMI_029190 [Orobanche minor]